MSRAPSFGADVANIDARTMMLRVVRRKNKSRHEAGF